MKKPWLKCNCELGDQPALHPETCPVGASQRAHARAAARREVREKGRALQRFASSIRASARKMAEDLVEREMDDLLQHAMAGRGFRINIMITEANGMPWKAEPEPEEPAERLIISPSEQ